jgi:hypothetical protein
MRLEKKRWNACFIFAIGPAKDPDDCKNVGATSSGRGTLCKGPESRNKV